MLIYTIIFCLAAVLLRWFRLNILSKSPAVVFILDILLLVLLAILISAVIVRAIRKEGNIWIRIACLIIMAFASYVVLFYSDQMIIRMKTKAEMRIFGEQRMDVIGQIKNGDITPIPDTLRNDYTVDGTGQFMMPEGYGKIAENGKGYIYKNKGEEQVIGFYIWERADMQIVYSSEGEELFNKTYYRRSKAQVIEKLDDNWFLVSPDYH